MNTYQIISIFLISYTFLALIAKLGAENHLWDFFFIILWSLSQKKKNVKKRKHGKISVFFGHKMAKNINKKSHILFFRYALKGLAYHF